MSMTINTNIPSLQAQIDVNNNQNAMNQSLERLSSGLRINSAKDDAAGLAISSRFTSQVSGLNQAVRNANDGISMLQTAEGSMQQVTSLLQSMRTLAVQASNDTNSTSDRASIQAQMDQLYAEIDRVASSTSFNGVNLLDGTGGSKTFQVGANADQTINVSLASVKTQDLSLNGYSPLGSLNSGRISTSASTVGLTIDGTDITMAGATSAAAEAAAINTYTATTGVTATAYNTYRGQGNVTGVVSGLTINGYSVGSSASMNELVRNINRDVSGLTGVTAVLNSDGSITLSNTTGNDITVGGVTNNSGLTASTYHGYLALSATNNATITVGTDSSTGATGMNTFGFNVSNGASTVTGTAVTTNALAAGDIVINGVSVGPSASGSVDDMVLAINSVSTQSGVTASKTGNSIMLVSSNGADIRITGTSAATIAKAGFTEQGGSSEAVGSGLRVSNLANANIAITRIDAAINTVSQIRGNFGSVQNRLDSTVSNLQNISLNLSTANSQITDADFAAETANFSKSQILVQAGVAMLAQAKQLPQEVMQLLK